MKRDGPDSDRCSGTDRSIQSLNGIWQLARDPDDRGLEMGWQEDAGFPSEEARPVHVPGHILEAWPGYTGVAWYRCRFVSRLPAGPESRCYLRFGAVQYSCDVWLDGFHLGSHEGASSPFEFDVTECLRPGAGQSLIVRVFSPRSFFKDGRYPVAFDMGGIHQPVSLAEQPRVRLTDVFVRPDIRSGDTRLEVTVENNTGNAAVVSLTAAASERRSGLVVGTAADRVEAPPGSSVHRMTLPAGTPHLWSPEDPFLYSVSVRADWMGWSDIFDVPRVGFRELRIGGDGCFELNGRRIYLKSAHSNVYDPVAILGTPRHMTWIGQDARLLKSAGFNMMRFICYSALPEQLAIADEIGLMIYNEHQGSWMMRDPARFAADLPGVIRRDRNHPSLVIWGLLNEVGGAQWEPSALYPTAKAFLPVLRDLDDTRLVMVSSGRWDADFTSGCASNPGSRAWDVYLGGENPMNPRPTGPLPGVRPRGGGAYQDGGGDLHVYHLYPADWEFIRAMMNLGAETRPLFLSEAGSAGAFNAIGEKRKLDEAGAPADAFARTHWVDRMCAGIREAWERHRLGDVYPDPEEMLLDSQRIAARQRSLLFSMVRGNPKINGYSLTSILDCWGYGEGVMDAFREFKPDHLDVLRRGWAGVRWCLFVEPSNVYSGQPVRVLAALANEDVLPPGRYPARLRIAGPGGEIWRQDIAVEIPPGKRPPLAVRVFDGDADIGAPPPGRYCLIAERLSSAEDETGGFSFIISAPVERVGGGRAVATLGAPAAVGDLLRRAGFEVAEWDEGRRGDGSETIVVGAGPLSGSAWSGLYARMNAGAYAVFLDRRVFQGEGGPTVWLPLENRGTVAGRAAEPELYHGDYVARSHPIMDGLPVRTLSPEVYGSLLRGSWRFKDVTPPAETVVAFIFCTMGRVEDGLAIGVYRSGRGGFILNALNLIENLGRPAADRLVLNMVSCASERAIGGKVHRNGGAR
ncbi:MAG: hypothetical protein N3A38_00935 [Planctomycetota bacterium]|nr:hypothetical protein [Planctomycetota bacterium]